MNEFNYEGWVTGGAGATLRFMGDLTGAEINALTADDVKNGYVYNCTEDYSTLFHENYEYAAVISDEGELSWSELGSFIDLSGYVRDTRTINNKPLSSDITLTGSDITLQGYTPQTGGDITESDTTNSAISKIEARVITLESENKYGF